MSATPRRGFQGFQARRQSAPFARVAVVGLLCSLLFVFGCGSSASSGSGTSEPSQPTTTSGSNVQAITVNSGPSASLGAGFDYVDGAFTSVTVCVPATSTCQTIDGVLVDTGSSGLRILSSALTVSLPSQTDSNSNPMAECAAFEDGITWGPVVKADVKMASEVASSMPVQVIGSPSFSTIPGDCSSQGSPLQDLQDLGANGLLGIGQSIQDCGPDCATSGPLSTGVYYTCPSSGCTDTTEALSAQVQNPVASFATDNNGVIVELPSVTGVEASVSGSLIFGIGTESNNSLGGATVFGTDDFGDMSTTYSGNSYLSFLDSGSNAIYFLSPSSTGLPECTQLSGWYCPTSTQTFSVTNQALAGTNGASANATFTVGNASTLTSVPSNAAVAGLAGPNPNQIDFGLPFFFGRNVFVAFEGKSTPAGTGPYTAY